MALQELQKNTGRKDREYIRRLSMFHTREAMEVATRRAMEDAEDIRLYLSDTQKKVRRISMF